VHRIVDFRFRPTPLSSPRINLIADRLPRQNSAWYVTNARLLVGKMPIREQPYYKFLSCGYDMEKSERCHGCRLGEARRGVAYVVWLAAALFWPS